MSRSPFESLWNLSGVSACLVAVRTWKSIMADRLFGHAAELGFYFLFSLFPTLFCAGSILGGDLAAKLAVQYLPYRFPASVAYISARVIGRTIAMALLILSFALPAILIHFRSLAALDRARIEMRIEPFAELIAERVQRPVKRARADVRDSDGPRAHRQIP